jgi:hypothetical protein
MLNLGLCGLAAGLCIVLAPIIHSKHTKPYRHLPKPPILLKPMLSSGFDRFGGDFC